MVFLVQPELPHRSQRHYCRDCGLLFPAEERRNQPTPHAQVWLHLQRIHGVDFANDYESCSRYCVSRAQSEEVTAGKRLYGKGIPHARVLEGAPKYEDLFPDEPNEGMTT